jgi:hypothetical protein
VAVAHYWCRPVQSTLEIPWPAVESFKVIVHWRRNSLRRWHIVNILTGVVGSHLLRLGVENEMSSCVRRALDQRSFTSTVVNWNVFHILEIDVEMIGWINTGLHEVRMHVYIFPDTRNMLHQKFGTFGLYTHGRVFG